MQIIFHIDLNAFFASAELIRRPELKGKPIVISRESKRGIVSTASYEARRYGIHSAMPLYKAKELCKELIVVEPHYDLYSRLSHDFFEIIRGYSKILEIASIDECYIDITEYIKKHQDHPAVVAKRIQDEVQSKLQLSCSIGISPNKFLSKMASDMKKPMGITIITRSNIKEILWPIPIGDMYGIGKKTTPKLEEVGIKTIGDLANYNNYDKAKNILGKNTLVYYNKANGHDLGKVNPYRGNLKSVGNSKTFENDLIDDDMIQIEFRKLSKKVSDRAKKDKLIGDVITITIKYSRNHSITRQMIIHKPTNDFENIYSHALLLFREHYEGLPIRLLGVSINNVIREDQRIEQLSLFQKEIPIKKDYLIQDLNKTYNFHLMKASDLLKKKNK